MNHTLTGQAVYTNVTIYGSKYLNGFGGTTNFEMGKSARRYMADTVKADKFFAYTFARHPVPGNPFVYIVPSDTNKMLQGINVNDTAFIGFRLYVNSVTKIGPDPMEVILDRTVLLRESSTGLKAYENDRQIPAMKVFPNPVKDKAILEISLPEWSEVTLSLYNPSGQQMGKAMQIDHVRGTIHQEIKLSGQLPAGQYILRGIVSEKGTAKKYPLTSKIVFLRESGF